MQVRYPALVRYALAPRHRYARPVVIAPQTDIEVPLLASHDMPEALRITHGNNGDRPHTEIYRTYAGKLYKKHSRHTVDELLLSLENPLRFDGVFQPLLREIAEHLHTIDRAFKPWPDGIEGHLKGRRNNPDAASRALDQTHLVGRHGIEEFDIHLDFWREKFLKQVGLYAVMDGDLWVVAPEPVIQISYGPPVAMKINEIGLSEDFSENLAQYFFAITELEAAETYARQMPSARGRVLVDRGMSVEIVASDVLSGDMSTHEIRRLGENLLRALNQFMPLSQGNSLDVARTKLLEKLRPRPFDFDALAEVIDETLTVCRTLHRELGQFPFSHYQASIYRRHLDRWDNRPIEVLNDGRSPLPPSSP